MEYAGDPQFADSDGQWIVGGPNSGGVQFYVLWREHLFLVEQEFSSGTIGPGIAAAEFFAAHQGTDDPRIRPIVEALEQRALAAASAAMSDPVRLHAALDDAQARGDWSGAVEILRRLVELECDPKRSARYHFMISAIQRVDLADPVAALESLDMCLDCDPTLHVAFTTQCEVLAQQQDWKTLERAHRKMIVRVRGQGDTALEFGLYSALAAIYRDRLDSSGPAIAAFEQALALRPDDADTLAALQALGDA